MFTSCAIHPTRHMSCSQLTRHFLRGNWYEEGRRWTRERAGLKLPKMEFFSLFNKAWQKTATVENAQAGFRGTGMFPLNKNIVPAEVYAPSTTTERAVPLPPTVVPALPPSPAVPPTDAMPPSHTEMTLSMEDLGAEEIIMSPLDDTSFLCFTPMPEDPTTQKDDEQPSTSTAKPVTFIDLIPIPKRERGIQKRAKPPSYRLTSTRSQQKPRSQQRLSKQPAKQKAKPAAATPVRSVGKRMGVTEEWISCQQCHCWFHESCGEDYGIMEDEGFVCKECV
ncbi:uncharacterized protein LOC121908822 isoform X2 [Thunnus maccoyii]|uniref:uncharacterized protein LOC121908822 isoform X2 n=1 Tax=Thunnus maccoyii TaxID=8240 RepID=UPI001C4DAE74|nr:uncharacterized protein LOC121908822 isoform X2 [Thunnus maccoyii]